MISIIRVLVSAIFLFASAQGIAREAADVLPSWADSANRKAIVEFVEATVEPGGPDYVAPAERIAVFDNDGTLWSEQPMYFQLAYAIDRVRELAPTHPEWRDELPFSAVLKNDMQAVFAGGEESLLELVMATHAGNTTDEFAASVNKWLATARHPKTGKLYTQMVYQPMLETLTYLRANGYKTYIVSGGGIEFLRVFAEAVYGVPPEQVVGSSIVTKYEVRDAQPALIRQPQVNFIDDKEGKPVAINQHIGRIPVIAFGNSDGDFQMLEWTTAAPGARLGVYVRHDDAEREWAYDRKSSIGRLDRGLDEAGERGWLLVSMQIDWRTIYPDASN